MDLWYAFYNTNAYPEGPPSLDFDDAWYYGKCKDFLTTNKQRMLVTWKRNLNSSDDIFIGKRICCQFDDYKFYYGRVMTVERKGKRIIYIVRYDDNVIRRYTEKQVLTMIRP